jgi:hypothetical protein
MLTDDIETVIIIARDAAENCEISSAFTFRPSGAGFLFCSLPYKHFTPTECRSISRTVENPCLKNFLQ